MPIEGVEWQWQRLQRLGFVSRGYQKEILDDRGKPVLNKAGKPRRDPVATEYFMVPDEVKQKLGEEKPTRLPIYFLLELEKALEHFLMRYSGNGKLRCMGDGESVWYRRYINASEEQYVSVICNRVARWTDITDAMVRAWGQEYGTAERYGGENGNTMVCLHQDCPQFQRKYCKPTAFLRFGIEGIVRQGYYQMTVHHHALRDLMSQLRWARDIVEQYLGRPTIMHVPFWMTLIGPDEMWVNGIKTKVWTPRVEIQPDWLERAMQGRVRLPNTPQVRVMDIWGGNGTELPIRVPEQELDVTPEVMEDLDYEPNGDEADEAF